MKRVLTLRVLDRYGDATALGTGFVVDGGIAVTNAHVLRGASKIELLDATGTSLGTVESYLLAEPALDLALITIPGESRRGLQLAAQDATIGDYVMAIGSPMGLAQTVSDGIASGIRSGDGAPRLQITAPISPGSSGGPVLNRAGQVVGVAVQSLVSGQNLNFAVPVSSLRPFLGRARKPTRLEDFRFASQFESPIPLSLQPPTGELIPRIAVGRSGTFTSSETSVIVIVDGRAFEEVRLTIESQQEIQGWNLMSLVGGQTQVLRASFLKERLVKIPDLVLPANGSAVLEVMFGRSPATRPLSITVVSEALAERQSAASKTIQRTVMDESHYRSIAILNLDTKTGKSFVLGSRKVRVSSSILEYNNVTGFSSKQTDEVEFDCEAREFRLASREMYQSDGKTVSFINLDELNFGLRLVKELRPVDGKPPMLFVGHFACGMWGAK